MSKTAEVKDLAYYKANAEEDYLQVPISVLRYIGQLEQAKELEKEQKKQQIQDAWENGNHSEMRGGKYLKKISEQYYNETFKNK